ncbi:hypothetical protein CPB86DRAFT_821497 [Serendipita vermifera]|nr:hypothetical protein CPB86DRAFT_821497 [Serendipita vermifera]
MEREGFKGAQKFPRQRREGIGLSLGYDQREEGNQAAEDKVYDAEQDVLNARILEHCSWEGTADCVNAIQAIPPLIVITPSSMHPCGFLSEFSVTLSFLSLSPVSPLPPPSSQGTPTTRRRIILRQIPQPFANRNRSLASKEFLSIPNSSGALGRLSTITATQTLAISFHRRNLPHVHIERMLRSHPMVKVARICPGDESLAPPTTLFVPPTVKPDWNHNDLPLQASHWTYAIDISPNFGERRWRKHGVSVMNYWTSSVFICGHFHPHKGWARP